jgi:putative ABC transport system permease protein
VIGAPLRWARGVTGSLARENAMRNPRRTAGTASALMVGVGVVTLFTVVAASLKTSVDDIVSEQFAGDLVIEASDFSGSGLDPRLVGEIAQQPEVSLATSMGNAPLTVGGDNTLATTVEPRQLEQVLDMGTTAGSFENLGDRQIAVSQTYADDHHLAVGEQVPVRFGDGSSENMAVGAVYDNDELLGGIVLSKAAYEPHSAARATDVVVLMNVADGVSIDQAKDAIQPIADRFGADVQDRDEYIDSVAGEVNQILTIVYALLVIAILIALMGIANTLSLSVHERTRELGLLRAVGQTRRQLRKMVRGESIVVALFGAVGGLGLGSFLGWALFQAIGASEGFGTFAIPAGQLVLVLGLGALVGVVAAVRPARRAAKLDVLEAIATD